MVHYGVTMGDGAVLAPDSFLMKGEQVRLHTQLWAGTRPRRCPIAFPGATPRPRGRRGLPHRGHPPAAGPRAPPRRRGAPGRCGHVAALGATTAQTGAGR